MAYTLHPRITERRAAGPATVDAQHNRSTGIARLTARIAVAITSGVGTMACAGVFTVLALVSLPAAIGSGDPVVLVQWVSSVFLQLVLLAVLQLGSNLAAKAADQRAADTFADVEALLHGQTELAAHLTALSLNVAALRTDLDTRHP